LSPHNWALQIARAIRPDWQWHIQELETSVFISGFKGCGWTPQFEIWRDGKMGMGPQELMAEINHFCPPNRYDKSTV